MNDWGQTSCRGRQASNPDSCLSRAYEEGNGGIAAHGVNVFSTFPNHRLFLGTQNQRSFGYDVGNGTSMSSPTLAAVAARAWSSHVGETNSSVRANVKTTADKVAGNGTYRAPGRVNANKACLQLGAS